MEFVIMVEFFSIFLLEVKFPVETNFKTHVYSPIVFLQRE